MLLFTVAWLKLEVFQRGGRKRQKHAYFFLLVPCRWITLNRLNQAKPNSYYPWCQSTLSRTLLHFCGTTLVETAVHFGNPATFGKLSFWCTSPFFGLFRASLTIFLASVYKVMPLCCFKFGLSFIAAFCPVIVCFFFPRICICQSSVPRKSCANICFSHINRKRWECFSWKSKRPKRLSWSSLHPCLWSLLLTYWLATQFISTFMWQFLNSVLCLRNQLQLQTF